MLHVDRLSVTVGTKPLLHSVSFTIQPGTVTACLGTNGSGKSSLLYALMGHPRYAITGGALMLNGECITDWSATKRAKAGLFLSPQHPVEIPGVTLRTLLKESFCALYGADDLDLYVDRLTQAMALLSLDYAFLDRSVHAGLSGGEKKITEMLQLLVLRPRYAFLDELDSGLDVDATKRVIKALQAFRHVCPDAALVIISHHARLFDTLIPDQVIVLEKGCIQKSGGAELVSAIHVQGFGAFTNSGTYEVR